MNSLILAFGYKMRRGKDSACRAIIEARGSQFNIRQYSFAQALKEEINQAAVAHGGMLGLFTAMSKQLPESVKYDPSPDMTDPLCPLGKQRLLLQHWGMWRRRQDPFYWVKKLRDHINADKPQVALISDVRMLNEVAWITQDRDNRIIRLDRTGYQEPLVVTTDEVKHVSECELDSLPAKAWHYTVEVTDGDIKGLQDAAVFIFDEVIEQMTPKPDIAVFPDEALTEYAIDESKEEIATA